MESAQGPADQPQVLGRRLANAFYSAAMSLVLASVPFSGVLSLAILQVLPDDPRQKEFAFLFGDLDRLSGSEHDPAVWLPC